MKKRLQVGKVYYFNYKRETPLGDVSDHEYCVLMNRVDLIIGINEHKEKIAQAFKEKSIVIKTYKKQLDYFEKKKKSMTAKEKKTFKKNLEIQKAQLFPKANITDDQIKANNLFLRFFNPENMEFNDDGAIRAIYAGKRWTPKGNIVHKWFQLSPSLIKRSYYKKYPGCVFVMRRNK